MNGSEINGYIFTVFHSTTAAIWVRYGTGIWQQVGTDFTGTFASGDVYKLAIDGNVLTVYRNGVSLGTRTDTNNRIPAGGSAGMSIVNPGTWDDWQGGDTVPPPTLSYLSPSAATVGGSAFTMTANGNNFLSGAKVRWDGSDRVTTFLSATQLQASITAADIATGGTVPVMVLNPDGGISNTMNFEVWGPAPAVNGLSPSYATAGGAAFTLTVSGSNFLSGAKVRWNGSDRVTTFVSATQLRASILAADIAATGTIPVTVLNPDGGLSSAIAFTIWAPPPTVMSLSPSYAAVGGPAFTLTVSGSNFVSGSKVRWNGTDRGTTFVSASQLRASILASDIAATGTFSVTVINSDGSVSNTMSFDVRVPVSTPTVTGLSPAFATAGGAAFTLTVSGINFVSGAKVRWNGSDRVTSFISVTELQASISAADIATSGTANVTVYTPPPGGGTSNGIAFDIYPVLSSLAVSPSSVVGGSPSTGAATLNGPAPVGGAVVSLSSDNTLAANVPASVTVAGGASSATFPVTTSSVSGSTVVTISGLYGGITRTALLTVTPAPAVAPVVTGLSPSVATAGDPSFTLTVTGSDFVSGSKVRWNGSDRVTTFVSATQLQASILVADIATVGTTPVTVLNPDGSLSNAVAFAVTAPVSAYTDNFNRANESPLQGNWATWDSGLGTLELYNNQLRSTDRNPYNVWGRRPYEVYSANHHSQIKSTSIPTGETGGPAVRVQMNGSEINGYIFTVANSTTASIWVRYGAGTWEQVGTNFTGTFTSGDVYKLAINGNVLTVNKNGVSLGTRTDGNNRVPSGGAAGVSVVYPGTWDDWQGGDGSLDSSPPYVISQSPPSGAMSVPKSNRLLSFHVADSGTGINSSFISATIAGATYSCSSGLSCTGSPNDITVTYVNSWDWMENQLVAVSVNARDIAGNVMPTASYTFSIGSWSMAWSDEFDNDACTTQNPCPPDMTKWIYEVSSDTQVGMSHSDNNHYYKNRDAGWGTDRTENVRVENGTLVLETRNDNWQAHGVTSGRLRTAGGYSDVTVDPWVVKKQIQYGRLEARAKMDSGDGLWSAFWTAGVGPNIWPASGEIDILEQPYWIRISNNMTSSNHSGTSTEPIITSMFSGDPSTVVPGFDITQYHIYTIEWKPGEIKLFYDYNLIYTATPTNQPFWPYDTYPQDLRLWHGFNSSYGASPSTTLSTPKRITFDYVRYYTQGVIAPTVTGLSPFYATAGDNAFTLTVTGTNFFSGAKVRWNGSDRVTTFVSATELRAAILAADVATAGTAPVTVFNPDGSLSNAMAFEIRGPQPAIISLSPSWGTAGGPSFTLIVDGSNFVSGSKVRWDGSDRATSFVSGTELQASISAADIASAGTAGVTVYTPSPGGGTSNAINFDILAVLTGLTVSPSSVVGGSPSTGTVTLTGPAPGGGAVVSLSSDNTLAANVPASVTVSAGATSATFPVTTSAVSGSTAVTISASYGGVTRTAPLTVTPVVVGLSSLGVSPSSVEGGSPSTGTVTLSGPAPVGGAVVSLSSDNTLAANVPASVTVAGGASSATSII